MHDKEYDDLYEHYVDKFNDCDWQLLVPDMIVYFNNNQHALDSFREWWADRELANHDSDHDDYLAEQAWHDFNE